MVHLVELDRVAQRADDVLLADHLVEGLGAVAAVEREHRATHASRASGRQASRAAATAVSRSANHSRTAILPVPEREHDEDRHLAVDAARGPAHPPRAGRDHPARRTPRGCRPRSGAFSHIDAHSAVVARIASRPAVGRLLRPVRARADLGVLGVEVEDPVDVPGVPLPGELADERRRCCHGRKSGPCTRPRSWSSGVPADLRLRPGWSAAHERYRLRLLPPGSDLVRERSPRGTRPSTPLSGVLAPRAEAPRTGNSAPLERIAGDRAPLPPRLARSAGESRACA